MDIIDLADEHLPTFLACLKQWCDEQQSGGDHKADWWRRMKERGLRVKLAKDDDGAIAGMIQYLPIEHASAEGSDLYYIQCIWVHGYKEGIGDRTRRGAGTLLLQAAEDDARRVGANGIVAWGMDFPYWNPISWYTANGYVEVDKNGHTVLAWKPFADDAEPPKLARPTGKKPNLTPGKVTVTALLHPWCQDACVRFERARRAAESFGDDVVFNLIDTTDPDTFREWGITNAVFVDEELVPYVLEDQEEAFRTAIRERQGEEAGG
jgi:GNAT superfamily N-acetyltransferase